MRVEADGEIFEVVARAQPDGSPSYDFTWVNGPDGPYGFTVGITVAGGRPDEHIAWDRSTLQQQAAQFVQGFFADDGIGPADFPDFVAARRG